MALLTKSRTRRLTKKMFKQWEAEGSKKFKNAAARVLSNDTLKEAVETDLVAKLRIKQLVGDKRIAVVLGKDDDTPILTCLWENREEIIKFVLTIIAMFPKSAVAPA
jgi:hypothetical protein